MHHPSSTDFRPPSPSSVHYLTPTCPPPTCRCPLSNVHHPPYTVSFHRPLSTFHRPLSTVDCPSVHRPLSTSTVHNPLPTIHCPPSTVHHPLSTIHCSPSTIHPRRPPSIPPFVSVWSVSERGRGERPGRAGAQFVSFRLETRRARSRSAPPLLVEFSQ